MTNIVAPSEATQEQFLRLLCADDALLRDEFDAIVAANFSEPAERDSTPPQRTHSRRRPNPVPPSKRWTSGRLWAVQVDVPADFMARQRAPPA
ncbi:hypothetical protein [Haloechinothrix halophila]|uniref:Uncharacterized protein n=1 Tax=Haloechinothrix halophila YIM 93223 TaxID=592678 RepID=W9DNP9_9PSEU|nr:hypothetical protein [Haloechinothrix halophila]ETA66575.1 hypothetical protein AmyhaDRAFT_0336 [Haloechinothrix halophila YIM 93223]